jgi:hypothetical protein
MHPPLHGEEQQTIVPVKHELAQDAQIREDLKAGTPLKGDRALIHEIVGQLVAISGKPDEDQDDARRIKKMHGPYLRPEVFFLL